MTGLDKNKEWRGTSGPFTPLFDTQGSAGSRGTILLIRINEGIYGRVGLQPSAAGILSTAIVNAGDRDHLEIGSFFGGSAILAALTKKEFDIEGDVYCVDNFSFEKDEFEVGPEVIYENAGLMGVRDRIKVFEGQSNPLPIPEGRRFVSAFIDATHSAEAAYQDFQNCAAVTDKYIIFHDVDREHPGVIKAVRMAAQTWDLVYLGEYMAVLENPAGSVGR